MILSALAALSLALGGCSGSKEIKVVTITSNPDSVEVVGRVYAVTDARLAAIDFTRFMKSEQIGENTLRSDPQKLRGYQSLSNAVALVIERKIHDGATLKPGDFGATLHGVERVPEEYKDDFKNGTYSASGNAANFTVMADLKDREGHLVQRMVGTGGTMSFVWFLPKATRTCELVIGSAKSVSLELPKND